MNDPHGQDRRHHASLGLRDLMIFVLAAGVSCGLAASAVDLWGNFPNRFVRPSGVAVVMLAVWLCVPLARGFIAIARASGSFRAKGWPIAWRAAVMASLCGLLAVETALLRLDWARIHHEVCFPPINTDPLIGRSNTLPILLALAIFGITAALAPVRPRPLRAARGRWVIVAASAFVGTLVMALWWWFIPHLILLAIDSVSTSLTSRSGRTLPDVFMRSAPPLATRIARASWHALAGCLVIVATGSVLSRDLRRDLSAEVATARRMVPRIGLVLATALAGWWLLHVSVPLVHPNLYDALGMVMEPIDWWLIPCGFATLAIGLASRSVTPSIERSAVGGGWRRGAKVVALLVLGSIVLASAASALLAMRPSDIAAVPRLAKALDALGELRAWLDEKLPVASLVLPRMDHELVARVLAVLWLTVLVARANAPARVGIAAPLDAVVASRSRIAWFLWGAVGLTVTCLAAMPALFLAGLAVARVRLYSLEWLGWNLDH